MKFHHVGCLVEDIQTATESYLNLLGRSVSVSKIYNIENQQVKVCFIELNQDSFIELVQPEASNASLMKMLKKRKNNFYHLAFKVENFNAKIEMLESSSYKKLSVFNSEAFNNKRCAFLFSPEFHLIEIIES